MQCSQEEWHLFIVCHSIYCSISLLADVLYQCVNFNASLANLLDQKLHHWPENFVLDDIQTCKLACFMSLSHGCLLTWTTYQQTHLFLLWHLVSHFEWWLMKVVALGQLIFILWSPFCDCFVCLILPLFAFIWHQLVEIWTNQCEIKTNGRSINVDFVANKFAFIYIVIC